MPLKRPRLLDLFCGAGGCAVGYHRAGFDVLGVDIAPQPHYPFNFIQGDALDYLATNGNKFDVIHASPPCQAYSLTQRLRGNEHPDMISSVRYAMVETGKPWVIENVEGSPLIFPIVLCGAMFEPLRVYRHRLFETSIHAKSPPHPPHSVPIAKMGRPPRSGEFMHVVGNFSGVDLARKAMGIDWMTRGELSQAVPPAYTEYVGLQLMSHIRNSNQRRSRLRSGRCQTDAILTTPPENAMM